MKVLLVDDHALFAKSLEIALEDYQDIESFLSIENTADLYSMLQKTRPDILLMDINLGSMSEEDGLLLAKHILEQFPEQKVIILSGYNLPVYQKEAKHIGAKGFVSKDVDPTEFMQILTNVCNGATYFPEDNLLLEDLTSSEKQVLELVATGMKRKDIASTLYMSERTVSNHLQHIFEKIGVTSTVEAVTKAIQLGYISPIS